MLPYMIQQRIDAVLSALEQYAADSDQVQLKRVAHNIIEDLQLPSHSPVVEAICSHPRTVREFGAALVQAGGGSLEHEQPSVARRIRKLLRRARYEDDQIRIRRFSAEGGSYYGYDFFTQDSAYAILTAEPVLITRITEAWSKELFLETEVGVLTRAEVKLIATLSFSIHSWHGPMFYFLFGPEPIDLPASLLLDTPFSIRPEILPRLAIATEVFDRIRLLEYRDVSAPPFPHNPFHFRREPLEMSRAMEFYNAFSLDDRLALRTAFLLLKSASLWTHGGRIFGEEATANLFFGMEGCLHLIHRRISGSPNFELAPVMKHVESVFPDKPGYVGMVQDAYEKRIQIVHPEPRQNIGWLPNVYADDFYENYGLANDLIYYGITGRTHPPEMIESA